MEYSLCSDEGIITTSSLSSSSSSSGSPSSSSSPSTNYPPSPPAAVTSSPPPSSSSSSSPNSPPTDLPPDVTSLPSSSRSVLPPVTVVVISSCAACKFLRRKCTENCMFAAFFPLNDPIKFTTVHRVFGASNISKLLQELPESQKADAVSCMVYEANARLRDPVYGCVGSICQLQKQVSDLQVQLATAQAEVVNRQLQQLKLKALVDMEIGQSAQASASQQSLNNIANILMSFLDDNVSNSGSSWDRNIN